jgi:two-component system nitrate/nitrite response regulator NarL
MALLADPPDAILPRFLPEPEQFALGARLGVVVADPYPLMLSAITDLPLRSDHAVVGSYSDGVEALEAIRRHRPPMAVLDLPLARLSGLDILRVIRAEGIGTGVVLLTAAEDAAVQQAISLGVAAVVPKSLSEAAVIDAIMACGAGLRRRAANGHAEHHLAVDGLSSREREIVSLVLRGLRNKQIAHHTAFSEASVKFRLYNIYRKLGVGSRIELMHKVQHQPAISRP